MPLTLSEPLIPIEYNLDLQIDHLQPNFRGLLKIKVKQKRQDQVFTSFRLHAKDLIVTKATLIGLPLKITYNPEGETVKFTASEGLNLTEDSTLELSYIGKINSIRTHHDETKGLFKTNFMNESTGVSDSFVLATHAQPLFARLIFPCIDELVSKCYYKLSITTDSKFKVISNTGVYLRNVDEDKGQQTVLFKKTPLMTTSLFCFCIGDLEYLKTEIKLMDRTIPCSIFSPQRIEDATFALDTISETLPLLERKFGFNYPLDKLDFVLLPFLSDMAMENWGVVTVQMNHLLVPSYALTDHLVRQQMRQLIVHELCHQWMGNYITFDSWEHLWFNESFATWMACDLLSELENDGYWSSETYLAQVENAMLEDAKTDAKSIVALSVVDLQNLKRTHDAFDAHSYNKGISVLRSMYCSIGKENFIKALAKIFADIKFHEVCVKPIDIFTKMGEILKSNNIANFFSSWTRTAGIPVVSVVSEGIETRLEQHRYMNSPKDIEDVPYIIPIFGKLTSGFIDQKHVLLTDRSFKLPYNYVIINSGVQGFYRVSYESSHCYSLICEAITNGTISEVELFSIFSDLKEFIGSEFQKKCHLSGLTQLLEFLASGSYSEEFIYRGLSLGLDVLQTIVDSKRKYSSSSEDSFVNNIYTPLWNGFSWDNLVASDYKLEVMAKTMFGIKHLDSTLSVAQKLMKNILNGPNNSIPIQLCSSVFATVSYHFVNIKQWKKLYELVKSSNGYESHILGGTSSVLQNLAIENLSFSLKEELIRKSLNFVVTNIDSTGIERALFGLSYNARTKISKTNSKTVRDFCWEWYTLNFDLWARKSIRDGSDSSEKMKKTFLGVSFIIYQMWVDQPDIVDQFLALKLLKYGKSLSLNEVWNGVKGAELSSMKVYQGILGF